MWLFNKIFTLISLQDPQKAIPKGTVLAIIVSTALYVGMAVMIGAMVVRDASGVVDEYYIGTAFNCLDRTCKYGLMNSVQVLLTWFFHNCFHKLVELWNYLKNFLLCFICVISFPDTIEFNLMNCLFLILLKYEQFRDLILFSVNVFTLNIDLAVNTVTPSTFGALTSTSIISS